MKKKVSPTPPAPPPAPSTRPIREKPYEFAAPRPEAQPGRPAPIMSSQVKVEIEPPKMTPPIRGPQTADRSMTEGQFVAQHASAEELKEFAAMVRARRAGDLSTWIWQQCDHCHLAMRVKPTSAEGDCCPKCNYWGRKDLGHMFRMSEASVNDYLYRKALKDKAAEERMARAAFAAANTDRAKSGLAPLSFEAFQQQRKAEFEAMIKRSQELDRVAAACRRTA